MIVSCVILNYNDAATTSHLVNTIRNYELLDHIIIIDNMSTDNSYDYLRKLQNEKIIVIKTSRNGGYGYGNNYGVKYAKEKFNSDYVLICNPDVNFTEDTLQSGLSIMQHDPNIAVFSPIQLNAEGKMANTIAWKIPTAIRYILCSGLLLKRIVSNYRYNTNELNERINFVDCVPGSLLLVNSEAFINVGGYDENIFLYCEETVLGKKMKDAGYKTVLDGTEAYYHLHSVSINKSIAKEYKQTKLLLESRYYVIKTYLGGNRIHLAFAKLFFFIVLLETQLKTMLNR